MLRVWKNYELPFSLQSTKAKSMSFSSYPGSLESGDDYYVTSQRLVVTETTIGVMNNSLFVNVTEQTVMYWIRVMVANRMATSGEEWMQYFALYNSGTYNNEWIVVDQKLFVAGKPLQPGTLWLADQIPGYVISQDVTSILAQQKYWPSYNIPYFPFVYDICEYPSYFQKYGNSFSYTHCARANIFRRDFDKVQTLDDMRKMMRHNEWQTDPLSLHDACRGISARCDLNPPWASATLNGYSAFGATDSKITDEKLSRSMSSTAVCGPTWDSQPPFAWTRQWQYVPQYGLPHLYAFNWETMKPQFR